MDVSKQMSDGSNRGSENRPETRGGFTRARLARQPSAGTCFGLEKERERAYLWVMTVHFPFQNSYAALPANFFARVAPTPVASPRLIKLNRALAVHLGLDPDRLASPEGA